MERVALAPDLSLSRMVYGMWRLTQDDDTSPARIHAKIEACLAQGLTTIDQAAVYGGYASEGLLGAALRAAPGLRDRIEIVTKCGIVAPAGRHRTARVKHYNTSAGAIEASLEASLTNLKTDRIDLLLIHRPDPLMQAAETGAALDAVVAGGKVRAVGVSNFRPHDFTLLQSSMQTPLVTNQIEISLQELKPFTNGDLAFLQERSLPPMAWSPLGGGSLVAGAADTGLIAALEAQARHFGTDRAAVAVAWLLAHPARILPVMGTNTIGRIERFSDAFKVDMDRETWFELYTAALGHEVA